MFKLRQNVFETNSSSSHALVVCSRQTWEDFYNGRLYYNVLHESNGYPVFCTWKQVKDYIKNRIENPEPPENWREISKEEEKKHKEILREHRLCFFQETFYSIDELENYSYDFGKQEAEFDYYFG